MDSKRDVSQCDKNLNIMLVDLLTSSRYLISVVLFSKFILGIPEAENFAFSFNTLLSDVAVKFPEFRSNIFAAQLTLLNKLCNSIQESYLQNTQLAHNTTSKLF